MTTAGADVAADLRLGSYDFDFPPELVADRPARPRDASRLLVLERGTGEVEHARFSDLPRFLRPGDCLVVNASKVLRARLYGRKPSGGRVELLLLRPLAGAPPGRSRWAALARGVRPGTAVELPGGAAAEILSRLDGGEWDCSLTVADLPSYLREHGEPPLPPYILKRRGPARGLSKEDDADYQTVYARAEGSVAAPTAGLHFTPGLLERLRRSGVAVLEVTLHVGHGTFQPLETADLRDHRMKEEWYRVEPAAWEEAQRRRREGGRLIAVGTSATRTLESAARSGRLEGWTDLFIAPGHKFRRVDALVTNFHLPRSTPLVLASAFAGRRALLDAYRRAVAEGYRLYSYGDAMLIR